MNTEKQPITIDEARKQLPIWLDMAAHNSIWSKYDELCDQAYKLLGRDEYDKIWKQWASGYVLCSDGNYRQR